jgi:hypothetical protein
MSKRSGRPVTDIPPGRKVTLSIRTTSNVKSELAAAAKEEGRNLSEHAEWLLRIGLRDEASRKGKM